MDDGLEFRGKGRIELQQRFRDRVSEDDMPGMEVEPLESSRLIPDAVTGIPDDGMSGGSEVNPDLVRPSGDGFDLQQAEIIQHPLYRIEGQGRPRFLRSDRDLLPVPGMPAQRPVDPPFFDLDPPPDHSQVDFFDLSLFELALELRVGPGASSHHHNPRGFFVQPVDDPRPLGMTDPLDAGEMMDEGIDEGPVDDPGPGMDDQPGGFVEDDDVLIGVNHVQGNLLGKEGAFPLKVLEIDLDDVPDSQFMRGSRPGAVQADLLVGDEVLDL